MREEISQDFGKRLVLTVMALAFALAVQVIISTDSAAKSHENSVAASDRVVKRIQGLSMPFVANQGQVPEDCVFRSMPTAIPL